MITQPARGKTFVANEPGEPLGVQPYLGNHVFLSNGERVQRKRYYSTSAIATGASDTTLIPAPADAQHYLVVLSMVVMCDAATLVTFRSNSTTIGMPLPIGANGGINRETNRPILRGVPGQPIAITTSGGNTYVELEFIEVPISVDIL